MVPPTGRISIGMSRSRKWVAGRNAAISGVFSLALAIEKQPRQAWPERTAQEHPPAYYFERERHRRAFPSPPKIERQQGFFGSRPGHKSAFSVPQMRFAIAVRKCKKCLYEKAMFKAFDFCIPTASTKVPSGPEWLHEIKHDGFRLRVERDGDRVRLITRGGHDWTKRYPWIVEAALKNRQKRFVIDGEAVILGVDGISDFDALHSGKHNEEVQLCAFDVLALDGDDLRHLPLSMRKANLARLLARRPDEHFSERLRTRRDRAGPIPQSLRVSARRSGIKASRPALPGRQVEALGQGEEPAASGDAAGLGWLRHISTPASQSGRVRGDLKPRTLAVRLAQPDFGHV
jgi:ATP-dependent DNA ligase